ncbi:ABC transporter substrate-binding protein [Treponema sp. Marseille-Q4132]|uniref:ABC transporter substrate-binding protein n=1 Tax=Treponema sp. Marseille-Q4132 TaxID=2766701 RepID=UPI0016531B7B|nr:extracellular solute-binding protein [Treponema sp. Marseille-Q4132]QNL97287.1 extracellular solute-binding protein [Treponema sp. Marseille-Q4132]
MNKGRWGLLLKHSAIIVCVSLLAGCMNRKTDSVAADIDFWSFPNFTSETGIQGDFEKELIAAFQKENPSINVRFTPLSYIDGADKIKQAIASGNVPDIVYDAPGRIITWADEGLLEPLDDVLATEKPYIMTGMLAVSAGKDLRTYMYPMHESPFSMAFNKEMLEDLGILPLLPYTRRDRQWTVAEYENLLRALKAKLPKGKTPGVFYYKTQGGDQGTRAFLVNLFGDVSLLNNDYSRYTFNTPQAVKNLEWTARAMQEGLLLDGAGLTSNDAIAMFVASDAAHTILYSPQLNKMNDGNRKYRGKDFTPIYMPFPNNSGAPSLEFIVGGACIFKNKNQNKIEAAKRFLHFMATDEVWAPKLVEATGGFPVTSKIEIRTDDPEILYNSVLQKFFGQYYNNITGFAEMRGYWNAALKSASTGKNIQSVLNMFVKNADETLKK